MGAGTAAIGHRTPAFETGDGRGEAWARLRGRSRFGAAKARSHGLAPPKRGFAKASRRRHSAAE